MTEFASTYKQRVTTSERRSISTTKFRELRLTERTYHDGQLKWLPVNSPDEATVSLDFSFVPDDVGGLFFDAMLLREGEESCLVQQRIHMTSTLVLGRHYRWWMHCPLPLSPGNSERSCYRRCAVLYFDPGSRRFGCRQCLDLTYRSSQQSRKVRKYRQSKRLQKIRAEMEAQRESAERERREERKNFAKAQYPFMFRGKREQGSSGGTPSAA